VKTEALPIWSRQARGSGWIPPLTILIFVCLPGCSDQTATAPAGKQTQPEAPAYFTVDRNTSAAIRGRVVFKGPRPARLALRIDEDPACQKLNRGRLLDESVLVKSGGALANVFVYVKTGLEGKKFAPPPPGEIVTIDQKSCRFDPHVLGVRVGQTLRITNSDPVTHNIHPQPTQNREWNQSQEPGAAALERKFVRPEIMMRVKCNVHAWMRAYVSAMDHPYFAVTGEDGSFEIAGLPPGDYAIEARHEKLGQQEVAATLVPSETKAVDFVFTGVKQQ
jgi:plastocyanin